MDLGRAMAQAVSRWPLTAEARARSRVSPCGICGGQSGTGTGFFPSTSVFPVNFIPPVLHDKEKRRKTIIFITISVKAAVRPSFCCGDLHRKK
jgi:hypothetical protein